MFELLGGVGFALVVAGGVVLAAGILSFVVIGRWRSTGYAEVSGRAPSLVIFWVLARAIRPAALACVVGAALLLVSALGHLA